MMRKLIYFLIPILLFSIVINTFGQEQKPDPNFFIYLCIGQSNMEAGARPEEQDSAPVDPRFQMLSAVDMPQLQRTKGNWYAANPPLNRGENRMGPVDFFGRTMVANLPEEYRVGVINVSVAGAKIELWGKDTYKDYLDSAETWMQNICKQYDGNPYQRLVDMAKIAQKEGVIKGLLIHQGESNSTDPEWCHKVKKIHDNLVEDLHLNPAEFYTLAGELKSAEEGGACAGFNTNILVHLPEVLPNAYIISSKGCKGVNDPFHFNLEGFRELGKRYAIQMLECQNMPVITPYHVELNVNKLGIHISPTLNCIFYEDINQANDGGICAQLIQNNSFQMYNVPGAPQKEFSVSPSDIFGWTVIEKNGSKGTAVPVDDKPLVSHTKYYDFDESDSYDDELKYKQYCIRFDIKKPGDGFGLAANGYGVTPYGPEKEGHYYSVNTQTPSLPIVAGMKYDLGLYLQGKKYRGTIQVYLENADGQRNSNILSFKGLTNEWEQFIGTLTAERSEDCRLVIMAKKAGTFYLDFVTLVPEASELWHNGDAGHLRKDLLEALEGLKPTFMRFPGGCASEGPNYWGQVFWKNSIGPIEERIGFRNHWGTWTSQHIGFYEYFLMAEELGAKPLPVLNNGVTCQFAGHSYVAPLNTAEDRQRFHAIYVQDALDLIEFCNGDATTKWGAVRVAQGHPAPFNLEYLAIGNENSGEAFWERFDIIYKAVKEKYPEINVITTSGARHSGKEFNTNYAIIDEKYPESIVDEHYYSRDEWFYNNTHRYDADQVRGDQNKTYDRKNPTRVFVGEFANNGTNNAYVSTLAEAAFFTGLERNSDMVVMAAYAPLFCKKGFNKWNSNLIWFDNRGLWRTTNYYYMSLFANNVGNRAFEISPFYKGDTEDNSVYTSSTIDTNTGILYVKVVNSENATKETMIHVNGDESRMYRVTMEYLTSTDTSVKNQGDQNYYSNAPHVENFNYDEPITPQTLEIGTVSGAFRVAFPAHSVNVVKFIPVEE
ncbi:alpha-L-arabinofuranosidase [Parabacteroides sp. PFB2-10]|uniref:sialate O-acetylesterase n=1 Tax=Parabacteroides sp. PFB2-10 TaxID=1742405 RepID=UPI0024756F66|nr:sialate O-acetylesterase [Parabacteroides sp. PFB2-10]MDH6313386.1 alpha-L-arabinofuranosidase [Parabacteroides sp. PFB2-10]